MLSCLGINSYEIVKRELKWKVSRDKFGLIGN